MRNLSNERAEPKSAKPGFTLIELLVVIAIIAILAAILFPAFARARENARRASCQSNVKQIMLGIFQYTQDYDEKYIPMYNSDPAVYWPRKVEPYLKSTQLFNCPSNSGVAYSNIDNYFPHYGLNTQLFELGGGTLGRSLASIEQPTSTVMLADSLNNPRVNPEGFVSQPLYDTSENMVQYRHLETTVVGFFDGHVKSMRKSALDVRSATDGSQTGLTGDDQFTLWNTY